MDAESRLDEAFAAYREVERPSERARSEAWAALERRITAGDTGPRLDERVDDEVLAASEERSGTRTLVIAVAVAAALGALWLLSPSATQLLAADEDAPWVESEHQAIEGDGARTAVPGPVEPPEAPRRARSRAAADTVAAAQTVEPVEPVEPVELIETDPGPEAEPVAVIVEPASPRREMPRPAARTVAPPQERAAPTLVDQARALQSIRALLVRDPDKALRQLEAHRAQAPDSPFAREREALMLLAECELGHAGRVADRVARVVAAQPGSPLAKRIAEACGLED